MRVQVKIPQIDLQRDVDVPYRSDPYQSSYEVCSDAMDTLNIDLVSITPWTAYIKYTSAGTYCIKLEMSKDFLLTYTEESWHV